MRPVTTDRIPAMRPVTTGGLGVVVRFPAAAPLPAAAARRAPPRGSPGPALG